MAPKVTESAQQEDSLWSFFTPQGTKPVQPVEEKKKPVRRSLFQSTGSKASKKDAKKSKEELSAKETSANTIENPLNGFMDGILNTINVTTSGGESNGEMETKLNEQPTSSTSSSSFLPRWGAVGSSQEEPKKDDKEKPPAPDSKWRTSSIQNSAASTIKNARPSVYEEALEMITAALLIYTFADLRKMAREGKIPSDGLTEHPITINQVMDAIRTHQNALEEQAKFDHNDLQTRLKALKEIQKRQGSSSSMMGRILRGSTKKKAAVLTHYHDEKCTQGMVYGIAVNHIRKRVTVVFRGSVTAQDFVTDAQLAFRESVNPVTKAAIDASPTIKLHHGFYDYMFKRDYSGRVRIEHILEDVRALLTKHKGYRLYCTGHSLGGALSTLCGFYAACDPMITKNGPVVVVSVASPRVGNDCFRSAFQTLERLSLLQHLRVSNKEDIVTLLPFMALKEATLSLSSMLPQTSNSVNLYKHCGINLKFKSGNLESCKDETELFTVTYAKDRIDDEGAVPDELKRSVAAAKSLFGSLIATRADVTRATNFHCCDEYGRRLENGKSYLAAVSLDQLYADRGLVGAVVASPPAVPVEEKKGSRCSFFARKSSGTLMV